jgi:hypothetical protein
MSLGFDFLEMTLNNGPSQSSQFIKLGNVDTLGGIITLVIQPVL